MVNDTLATQPSPRSTGRGCPNAQIDALADQNDLTTESYVDIDMGAIAARTAILGGRLIRDLHVGATASITMAQHVFAPMHNRG